jgi:hypothetical protein
MHSDRDHQLDAAGGGLEPPEPAHRSSHQPTTPRPSGGRTWPLEQQERRVPAPFQEVGPESAGDGGELTEGGADDLVDLFGPGPATGGQPLGQRREAGDVDEDERAVDSTMPVWTSLAVLAIVCGRSFRDA